MKDRASSHSAGPRATAARETARAPKGLAGLQRSAGNQAVASLLGGDAPRPVQRDDDWWSAKSLMADVDSVEKGAGSVVDTLNTPFRMASESIGKDVDNISKGIDWAENAEHSVVHGAADAVKDVPGLGAFANATADSIDMGTQLVGGLADGAVGLAGGLARGVVDPVDFVKNASHLVGKLPAATMLGAGEQAAGDLIAGKGLDAAENDLSSGARKSVDNIFGGLDEMNGGKDQNVAPKDAGILRQILSPVYGDFGRGKGAHGVGRVAANVGAIAFGGELAEVGDAALGTDAAVTDTAAADAAAADTAPATVRNPPVGDIDALSGPAQEAYQKALAQGRNPSEAFQEAKSLDDAAKGQGLGAKQPAVNPDAVPTPKGLTEDGESVFRARLRQGDTPAEAEQFARDMDDAAAKQKIDLNDNPNQRGSKARRGPRPGGGFS